MSRPLTTFSQTLAVAAIVGGIIVSPASLLAATTKAAPLYPQTTASEASAVKSHKAMSSEQRVEERIKDLHSKLKITKEQSSAWDNIATTMRENEKETHTLIKERHENAEKLTALEDLESYQRIASVHAEGLNRFINVFKPLYEAMSETQKQTADTVFGSFEGRRGYNKTAAK